MRKALSCTVLPQADQYKSEYNLLGTALLAHKMSFVPAEDTEVCVSYTVAALHKGEKTH